MKRKKALAVEGTFWLTTAGSGSAGPGRIELLEQIGSKGSISQAARDMGMSYKAAWQAVNKMNNLASAPLVERSAGGRHGGGTRLTAEGRELIRVYRRAESEFQNFLARIGKGVADFADFNDIMRRLGMQTSARNELAGTVKTVTPGAVNAEVVLDLGEGDELVAIITNTSVENLGLRQGSAAYGLIKAPWIVLTATEELLGSARNRLCGRIVEVTTGAVNSEVVLELASGKRLTAIVTVESVGELALEVGKRVCALIKASHVIVAVNA